MQSRGGNGSRASGTPNSSFASMAGDSPTPEALLAMLEAFQAQGGNMKDVPSDLQELLRSVKRDKGQVNDDVAAEDVTPTPGFVIKTADQEGRKVFINMCGSDKVAAPGNWANGRMPEDVAAALDNVENLSNAQGDTLRFPLSLGPVQLDLDRKGQPCSTYDIILNGDVIKQAATYRPLKSFLITTALSWVGHKAGVELSAKYKLPKMRYKGEEVQSQRIRIDRKPLVEEVCDVEEDPVFPLVTKKLPASSKAAASQAPAATAGAAAAGGAQNSDSRSASVSSAGGVQSSGSTAASHAGGGSSVGPPVGLQELSYVLSYEGRPVDAVEVAVTASAGMEFGSSRNQDLPRVEVCGRSVYISAPGCRDLHITLPLAVSADGASASVGVSSAPPAATGGSSGEGKNTTKQAGSSSSKGGASVAGARKAGQENKGVPSTAAAAAQLSVLRLRLPYLPLSELVEGMVRDKPFALGDLRLGDTSYLELDP